MKKTLIAILLIMTLILGITSCGTKTVESSKPVVYASFYPIYDLASKIGGDKITVRTIIPPGIEPHDWEPCHKRRGRNDKGKNYPLLRFGNGLLD